MMGGEVGDRGHGRQLRGDMGNRGADGGLTGAVTSVEMMDWIYGGETLDTRGVAWRRSGEKS